MTYNYTDVPIAAAGDWIDDAYINTYLGDNLRAILSTLTGAGQLLATTAASSLAKVPVTGNNGYLLTEDTSLPTKMKFAAPPTELPAGGIALQYLRINAGASAKEWATMPTELPSLGSAYQGLRVNSGAAAVEWSALPSVIGRQGGSASVWITPGTTNRTVASAVMQMGAVSITIAGGTGGATITFPIAFSNKPLLFFSFGTNLVGGLAYAAAQPASISTTQFDINAGSNVDGALQVNWLAIGPP